MRMGKRESRGKKEEVTWWKLSPIQEQEGKGRTRPQKGSRGRAIYTQNRVEKTSCRRLGDRAREELMLEG